MCSRVRFGNLSEPSQFLISLFKRRTMTARSWGWFGSDAAGEALVVEQFQQSGEALLVAIVRGGREEELVFEMLANFAESLGSLRVEGEIASATRCCVVGLVDNEDVESRAGRDVCRRGLRPH